MSMGGAQRSLTNLARELNQFYNVWIVVFNRNHKVAAIHSNELLSLDITSGSSFLIKALAFILRVRKLKKLKKHLNIDVSISFLEGADYVNVLSQHKDRVILSIRGSKVYDEHMLRQKFYLRKIFIRLLYRRADEIVCVNKGIANEISDFYGIDKVQKRVIYNFYDIDEIRRLADVPLPTEMEGFFEYPVIAMSGRLAVEKGHSFVVSLFADLKKRFPSLKLLMIGEGPERNNIVQLCGRLRLSVNYKTLNENLPDIFITGERENVFNLLKRASLYVLNSSSEGFPNGLAEAMACGLPALSSDCPYGPREILAPDTTSGPLSKTEYADYGILLPMPTQSNDSRKIWLETFILILENKALKDKYMRRGSERIQNFSIDHAIQGWRDVIEPSNVEV